MVRINGEIYDQDGKSVKEVLDDMNIGVQYVAVELNEEILPKVKYSDTILKDGDHVEIVRFVGGG
ncbi:sulfur carrier protein ThiS [Ruminococcus sp.]|uniref:sulfur carrier protein ThiS n=1 Tax=Ruminococcus sp. TaxID=41978 RepID=UPI0025DEC1BE|nr:sulfur carrier protein ThiS [Ruminococcus sp.]